MKLENVVPWGRNLHEYQNMFQLSKKDLQSKILGCGDGPSSFNFEITKLNGNITSIDPIYQFSKDEMIVAYYGRPGVSSLGVLGKYPISKLKPIIKAKVVAYKKATGNDNVVLSFDVIYGLAASEPGAHKDYIIHLNSKKLHLHICCRK